MHRAAPAPQHPQSSCGRSGRTRAALKREASEARLRVLLRGTSSLYAAVARAVRAKHEREARAAERRLALWRQGTLACGPSGGVLAVVTR